MISRKGNHSILGFSSGFNFEKKNILELMLSKNKGRVNSALPFLFISFGNNYGQDSLPTPDL